MILSGRSTRTRGLHELRHEHPGRDHALTTGSATATAEFCSDNEEANGLDCTAVNIPAGDPDGGLVVLTDVGVGHPRVAVLPSGTAVITMTRARPTKRIWRRRTRA